MHAHLFLTHNESINILDILMTKDSYTNISLPVELDAWPGLGCTKPSRKTVTDCSTTAKFERRAIEGADGRTSDLYYSSSLRPISDSAGQACSVEGVGISTFWFGATLQCHSDADLKCSTRQT